MDKALWLLLYELDDGRFALLLVVVVKTFQNSYAPLADGIDQVARIRVAQNEENGHDFRSVTIHQQAEKRSQSVIHNPVSQNACTVHAINNLCSRRLSVHVHQRHRQTVPPGGFFQQVPFMRPRALKQLETVRPIEKGDSSRDNSRCSEKNGHRRCDVVVFFRQHNLRGGRIATHYATKRHPSVQKPTARQHVRIDPVHNAMGAIYPKKMNKMGKRGKRLFDGIGELRLQCFSRHG